jgi:hypothetical protein
MRCGQNGSSASTRAYWLGRFSTADDGGGDDAGRSTQLTVDAVISCVALDLAGLIWESADRFSHPLLALETSRDYRGLRLAFRWTADRRPCSRLMRSMARC